MIEKWKYFILCIVLTQYTVLVLSEMYKVSLRGVTQCEDPDPPYEKERSVILNLMAYNRSGLSYFKGNLTITENLRGYYYKIKAGIESNTGAGIKYTNQYKKLTCKSVIPKMMIMAIGMRYNEKTCEMYKGTYSFNRLDINKLQPGAYYYPIKQAGESVVYFGVYGARGTVLCTLSRYVLKAN